MRRWIPIVFVVLSLAGVAVADEGMWLFNFPPAAQIKAKYGFELTKPWLQHVQLSSVRFNNGGSGSFVSPDGLAFTNHHVGATCINQLNTGGKDYMKTGFYAKTRAEEAKCPDLELNVLEAIEDVTQRVNANVKPGMPVADQGQAQRAAMSAIEQDCAAATKLRCDVITFYSGAVYHLYEYKKYTDVRLSSRRNSTRPFLAAIQIISNIRATISMSASSACTRTTSPFTWTTISNGREAESKRAIWSSSREIRARPGV
jgi:Peptidase S46